MRGAQGGEGNGVVAVGQREDRPAGDGAADPFDLDAANTRKRAAGVLTRPRASKHLSPG